GDLWIDTSKQPYVWNQWDGTDWKKATATDLSELDGELQRAQIAVGTIDSDRLADNAVTVNKILNGAISEAKIAADAVTSIKIANNAVNNKKLDDLAVTASKLADDSVTETKIANLAVGSAAIQDLAVKNQHVYNLHADKISAGVIAAERIAIGPLSHFEDGYDPTKIEIGGRNLLRNSAEVISGGSVKSYPFTFETLEYLLGETITISFYVRLISDGSTGNSIDAYLRSSSGPIDSAQSGVFSINNKWQRFSFSFAVTQEIIDTTQHFYIRNNQHVGNNTANINIESKWAQIEKGNKATDWTPAPEDNPALLWRYEDTTYIDGGKIYAHSVTANEIATGTITANELASNAVIADKIAANAITAGKIAANAVTSAKIDAYAVTADKIAANSISSNMIATAGLDAGVIKFGTMSGERIATRTIVANQIATGTLTANELASKSVTAEKINVNNLSAITANLGTVTAGTLRTVRLEGATGTFSGTVETARLIVNNPNIEQDGIGGLRLQVSQWQPSETRPFIKQGYIDFNVANNALEIERYDENGNFQQLDGFKVAAKRMQFLGNIDLIPYKSGATPRITLSANRSNDSSMRWNANATADYGLLINHEGTDVVRIKKDVGLEVMVGRLHIPNTIQASGGDIYLRPSGSSNEIKANVTGGTYVPIRAASFLPPSSSRESKKNIEQYTNNVIDVFRNLKVYTFDYANEEPSIQKRLGLMLDEAPKEIYAKSNDTIDLYSMAGYLGKGLIDIVGEIDEIYQILERNGLTDDARCK
ncbi:tail fiber domain-containing protein, partial [Pseudogracilibacillus auburnensis]|uniref:tail fiber domain-containing protein n=1 Tax=Pseudogracilibacillus auburnensis TaxID=1494959 RepID=UPI001A95AACC